MTTIPNGSNYETMLDGYFGSDYADTIVGFGTKKDVLWQAFLKENGLSPTDPLVVAQDPAIQSKFVTFLQKTYDAMQVNTLSPGEVTRRDLMFTVYDLVVLMLEVLQSTVGVVGNNVVFLNKYAKEYSEMMGRTSEAFYIGGSLSLPQPNRNDLSQWTLGYDDITMKEYLEAAIYRPYNPDTQPSGQTPYTYSISSVNTAYPPTGPNVQQNDRAILRDTLTAVRSTELIAAGPLTRDVIRNVGPGSRNTLTFSSPTPTTVTMTYTYLQQYDSTIRYWRINSDGNFEQSGEVRLSGYHPITMTSPTVTFGVNDTPEQKMVVLEAAFQNFLNQQIPNNWLLPPGIPPAVPFPYTDFYISSQNMGITDRNMTIYQSTTQPITVYGVSNAIPPGGNIQIVQNLTRPWNAEYNRVFTTTTDDHAKIDTSASSRRRGNANSLLQQFVSNTQSKRQILTNQADATQSNMDALQTGYNQGASLLKTMIGQLSTILTSIFQGAR